MEQFSQHICAPQHYSKKSLFDIQCTWDLSSDLWRQIIVKLINLIEKKGHDSDFIYSMVQNSHTYSKGKLKIELYNDT